MANTRDHVTLELETPRSRTTSPARRTPRDLQTADEDAEPLFETDVTTKVRPKPPTAEPENDEDDVDQDDDIPYTPQARPGVDDGFFPAVRPRASPQPQPKDDRDNDQPNGLVPGERRNNEPPLAPPRRNFPYPEDFGPNIIMINGVPTPVPDVNVYQHKKTLAQGMMDLALLSANANQLRYVLESYRRHPYYYVSLVFISVSLIFQIAVGVGLIMNSRYNVKNQKEICKANKINNLTVTGIFIVTVVNVFISAFGVADPPPDMNA